MTDCESAHNLSNKFDDILKLDSKNRSTPIKFLLDESSLFEFEQHEKYAETQSAHNSALFKDPINQLEKMIQNINTSNLDCTLESLNILPEDDDFQTRLENEIKKRVFLERKINELNSEKLELSQKLNITEDKLKKKSHMLKTFETGLTKTLDKWKNKEIEFTNVVEKVKLEKQSISIELTKMTMRNQLLEQEIKKMSDDLIGEKVKGQEYQNQIGNLNKNLHNFESKLSDKSSELSECESKIEVLRQEKSELEDEVIKIKSDLDKSDLECHNLKQKIEGLNDKNQSLSLQYDNLKVEYENLINEAKSVIEESERQYNHLTKTIEQEKLKKDTLQVEMNMIEEKYENKIKMIVNEYESKLNTVKNLSNEKEKALSENFKTEVEQIKTKAQYDLDKVKYKMSEEFKEKTNDYDSKIFNLNLKIDSLQNEITRLEAVNYDLENERNTIRRNLKQQLEIQMKETFELLGLENEQASKFKKSISVNNLQKISKFESSSCLQLGSLNKTEKLNTSLQIKPASPLEMSSFSTKPDIKTEQAEKPVIKDAFIINQIDLINKYYQIDNTTLKAAGAVAASNPNLFEEINVTCSPKKEPKSEKNTSMNNSRSSELKHYIELLLNKCPQVVENEEENKNNGYNDLSDIELGYTKKQSNDYYDDVKRNLNFDLSSSDDDDDSYDETENSMRNNSKIQANKKMQAKQSMVIKNLKNRK